MTENYRVLPPESEPSVLASDASQAFSEHVAVVQQQGDAFDVSRRLHLWDKARVWGSVGAGAGSLMEQGGGIAYLGLELGAMSLVARGYTLCRDARNRKVAEKLLAEDTQETVGHYYELVQQESGTTLLWYGPRINGEEETVSLPDSLSSILSLARDNNIARVVTPYSLAEQAGQRFIGRSISWTAKGLLSTKHFKTNETIGEERLAVFDTEPWNETVLEQSAGSSVEDLIGKLKGVALDGNHPLIKAHESGADTAKLRSIARHSLQRRLVGYDTALSPLADQTFMEQAAERTSELPDWQAEAGLGKPPKKENSVLAGKVTDDGIVHWSETSTESLDKALSMDDAERIALIKNPENGGGRAVLALEMTLLKLLTGKEEPIPNVSMTTTKQEQEADEVALSTGDVPQMYLTELVRTRRRGQKRLKYPLVPRAVAEQALGQFLRGMHFAEFTFIAAAGLTIGANSLYSDAFVATQHSLAAHGAIDPRMANLSPTDVETPWRPDGTILIPSESGLIRFLEPMKPRITPSHLCHLRPKQQAPQLRWRLVMWQKMAKRLIIRQTGTLHPTALIRQAFGRLQLVTNLSQAEQTEHTILL